MRLRKKDGRSAAATVELAVLLPFLLYLAAIGADWARLLYYTVTLEACARNGALYASDADYAAKTPYTSVQQAALAEAPQLTGTVSVNTNTTADSAGNTAVICTVTMPFTTMTNLPGVPNSQTLTRRNQMRMAELLIK